MLPISTPAILLRRIAYGDDDLICTFFSLGSGKISLMAKSAKKSAKRFPGILEPFSVLHITYGGHRTKALPLLQEASLIEGFSNIRTDVNKTAYAGYMAELIYEWVEEHTVSPPIFTLYQYALKMLDRGGQPEAAASIIFQMRFMGLSGFRPNINSCVICKTAMEKMDQQTIAFDLKKGGVVCNACLTGPVSPILLSKGALKQLYWVEQTDLEAAARIRFSGRALKEGLDFLEAFVPYHLGKDLRSLKFLHQLRK
jgi:DNA repair protein RecO (recombination protein O)